MMEGKKGDSLTNNSCFFCLLLFHAKKTLSSLFLSSALCPSHGKDKLLLLLTEDLLFSSHLSPVIISKSLTSPRVSQYLPLHHFKYILSNFSLTNSLPSCNLGFRSVIQSIQWVVHTPITMYHSSR